MEEFMDTDKTAIFVDGAFFIKRAKSIFGSIEPDKLADKLWSFSLRHIYPYHLSTFTKENASSSYK